MGYPIRFRLFVSTFALDVNLKFSDGTFNQADLGPISVIDLDIDATSSRSQVGVVWWF